MTTIEALNQELLDCVKVSATARQLQKKRLRMLHEVTRNENVPWTPANTEELNSILDSMTRSVGQTARLLLGPKGPGTGSDGLTADELLEEFVKGKPKV